MREKYESAGLNYDLIREDFPDLEVYEDTVAEYLADEFFTELERYLDDEDYELAKDAVKGLYILAGELKLYPLYEALLEIYEDLVYEMYSDVMAHHRDMIEVHRRIRRIFHV